MRQQWNIKYRDLKTIFIIRLHGWLNSNIFLFNKNEKLWPERCGKISWALKAHMITGTDKFEGCVCLHWTISHSAFLSSPLITAIHIFRFFFALYILNEAGVKSFVGHDVIMILFKYQRYFLPHEPAATSICEISKKGQFFTMGIYFRVWLVGWFGQTKTNGKKAEKPSSYKYIGYRHAIDWYSKPFTVARVPFLLFTCQTCSALLFMKIRFPRQNLLFIFVYAFASAFGS